MKNKITNISLCFSIVLLAGLLVTINGFANVRLPAIFTDKMILQQKTKAAVWGWADADEEITITPSWPSAKKIAIKTDAYGKWKLLLQTPSAGGPYTLAIQGKNLIEVKDILVGEVWVCSGQSNMVFSLKSSDKAKEEIAVADFPSIRYFSVKRQYGPNEFDDCPGSVWEKTTTKTAPDFSAVAYYFAKKIHQQTGVPVGIIYSAWGGTPAEAWTPSPIIKSDVALALYTQRWNDIQQNVGKDSVAYHLALNDWEKTKKTADSNKIKKPEEPQTLYYFNRPWREPSVLFNGMIRPVIPFAIKGVLWYQGESNVGYAGEYAYLFSAMIEIWRSYWQTGGAQKTLPFYFVQIAPFGYSNLEAAAILRQDQEDVSKTVKNTAMAVTIDLGNMKDIHFTHKKEVGDRLALIALSKLYGYKNLVTSGPVLKNATIQSNKIELNFDQEVVTTNQQNPAGFEIGYKTSDVDSLVFMPAQSSIVKNKIMVWNETVSKPVAVRYAWLKIGEANLVNEQGLPAAPFFRNITN